MSSSIHIRRSGQAEAWYAGRDGQLNPAWHGLGYNDTESRGSGVVIVRSGLSWTVELRSLEIAGVVQHNHAALVRSDTNVVYAIVTNDYRPIQNSEGFDFLDALNEDGIVKYESAFSLGNGHEVVIVARMPEEEEIVPGDVLRPYVLFTMKHGHGAIQAGPTATRVVCRNTLNLALLAGGIKTLSISHRGNIRERIQQARDAMRVTLDQFKTHTSQAKAMARKHLTLEQWQDYLDSLLPVPAPDDLATPAQIRAIHRTRGQISDLYHHAPQQQLAAGTAWAAYNAVSHQVDHLPRRGSDDRGRFEARYRVTQHGTGAAIKSLAYTKALALLS